MRAGAGDSGAVGFAAVAGVEATASGAGVTEKAGVIRVADGAGSSAVRSNRGSVMARSTEGLNEARGAGCRFGDAGGGRLGRTSGESADVVERRIGRRGRRLVGRGQRHDGAVVDSVQLAPDLGERLVFALESLDEAEAGEMPVVVLRTGARRGVHAPAAPG